MHVAEHDDETLLFVQLPEGPLDQICRLGAVPPSVGPWTVVSELALGLIVVALPLEGLVLIDLSSPPVQLPVLAVIDDHPVDPRRQLSVPTKVRKGAKESQEDILRDLFGDLAIPHPAETLGEDTVLIPANDLGVGAAVSFFEPPDQLGIRKRLGHGQEGSHEPSDTTDRAGFHRRTGIVHETKPGVWWSRSEGSLPLALCAPLPFEGPVLAERMASTDWSAFLTATQSSIEGLDFTFEVELRGPDPRMVLTFAAHADPIDGSVDETEIDGIATHEAVAIVRSEEPEGADAVLATAQRAQLVAVALIDAGALGVTVQNSGLAHGRTRWRNLLDETRDAIQRQRQGMQDATVDFFGGLLESFVRRPVQGPDGWVHTRGMHLLARPEVAVRPDEVSDAFVEVLDAFMIHQTAHRHPTELKDGDRFQVGEDGPAFTVLRQPDPWSAVGDLTHNPHGFWGLTRL